MDGSYPRKADDEINLGTLAVQDFLGLSSSEEIEPSWSGQGPHNAADFAKKLYACEALNPPKSLFTPEVQPEPYSLQWFLDIEKQRHSRQGRWIPKLLEFAKHSGELLLGLGHGLGTDWAQYARFGATVLVCSSSPPQLELIRRNFEVRGLAGQFVHAQPTRLPLESSSVDVAFLSSLHMGIDNAPAVVEEVYRVLKPGGKVLAVSPARYNVEFWFHSVFFWYRWFSSKPRRDLSLGHPLYSARDLKNLFHRFVEHRVHKRQLRRSDVPRVWRWAPVPLLARLMGRVLLLKAFKPLSAAREG